MLSAKCVMKTQSPDTSPEAEAVLIELTRRMPIHRKLALGASWSQAMRDMIWRDVRSTHPNASPGELRFYFAERWLGPELAGKAYSSHG